MVAAVSRSVTALSPTPPENPAPPVLRLVPPHPPRDLRNQPVRLTRRGRMVVATLVALLVSALMVAICVVIGAGPAAQATNHPISRQAAEKGLVRVTVQPGQSLWSVAEAADPDADPRVVIPEIVELNGLSGIVVNPGEQLLVPRG
jgi:hypothetical protein